MKLSRWMLLGAALLAGGCGKNDSATSTATAPVTYVGAVVKGQQTAVKTVDVVSLNQAIQLFNVQEGRNPKDLNELVAQKYIPEIPAVPAGMKINYDATQGNATIVAQ